MSRDSFIFYRSFFEALQELPKEDKADVLDAICEKALNFKDINLTGIAKGFFTLIKPQIEANNRKYENGIKPKTKPQESKPEANQKQNESKPEGNDNANVNTNEINISFDTFWNAYNKKVGSIKKIEPKWNKLKDSERVAIIEYIPKYITAQPDKKFRKDPATFLNNESWNDEIIGSTDGQATSSKTLKDKLAYATREQLVSYFGGTYPADEKTANGEVYIWYDNVVYALKDKKGNKDSEGDFITFKGQLTKATV